MKYPIGRVDLGDMLPALDGLFLMEKEVRGVILIEEVLFPTADDNT